MTLAAGKCWTRERRLGRLARVPTPSREFTQAVRRTRMRLLSAAADDAVATATVFTVFGSAALTTCERASARLVHLSFILYARGLGAVLTLDGAPPHPGPLLAPPRRRS